MKRIVQGGHDVTHRVAPLPGTGAPLVRGGDVARDAMANHAGIVAELEVSLDRDGAATSVDRSHLQDRRHRCLPPTQKATLA